jgi:curved DNA-binding protein CbpA
LSRPGPDLYALLGVTPTADAAEIGRAYRRRVREVHPDTAASAREPAELRAIQEAYLVLREPARRAEYDAGRTPPTTSRSVPVPVRVRLRPAPAADWPLRAGRVRVEPLPPRRAKNQGLR